MKRIFTVAALLGGIGSAIADPIVIVDGATISEIGNATSNEANFFVKVSGGTGFCANTVIVFPLTSAGTTGNDTGIHNGAYSAALAAFTSGKKVVVTNYDDSSCAKASKIKLTN